MKVVYTPPHHNILFKNITPYKPYEVVHIDNSVFPYTKNIEVYTIINDKGQIKAYASTNFTDINAWRENQLNKIIE